MNVSRICKAAAAKVACRLRLGARVLHGGAAGVSCRARAELLSARSVNEPPWRRQLLCQPARAARVQPALRVLCGGRGWPRPNAGLEGPCLACRGLRGSRWCHGARASRLRGGTAALACGCCVAWQTKRQLSCSILKVTGAKPMD